MKSTIFIIYLSLLVVNIFANQQVTIYSSSSSSVVRYKNANGNYDYNYNVVHNIGRDDGNNGIYANSNEDIWRSEYLFNLGSIPSNATITQAQLIFLVSGYECSTCSLKVTKTTGEYSYEQQWSAINNSNTIVLSFEYSSGSNVVVSEVLKNAIIESRSSGQLFLGALSLKEGTNHSYANIELQISVDYTVPVSNVSFIVDNNFTSTSGNRGSMVIDGTTSTIPLEGFQLTKNVGSTASLEAISPQNDNQFHQMIWHTGSVAQSDWKRNELFKSSNTYYSFTVAADDENKRYVANLRKNYKITRDDKTEFDGLLANQSTSYIVEQNSGQIITPSSKTVNNITYNFAGWTDDFTHSSNRLI